MEVRGRVNQMKTAYHRYRRSVFHNKRLSLCRRVLLFRSLVHRSVQLGHVVCTV